ncbi:short-chain collagen C4-like [Mytilus trossulus]|uniref:short-chain collagen C4-like n=1 Tax=Mytilus trossulus TaxID=6551 RepID=UPI003005DD01
MLLAMLWMLASIKKHGLLLNDIKLCTIEKEQLISTKADTEKLSVIEHQQIEGIRKLTEIEHQLLKSKEKGVTYIRWGKTQCDGSNTETLYSGQAGGSQYSQPGSSVNYLCLPLNPDGALPLKAHSWYAFLCGAEYQVNEGNTPQGIRSDIFNHDVACAACLAKGKLSSIMIPGWKTCNNGWTKEYDGILMAGHPIHAASSEYACVDKVTETIAGGSRDENGILFYPVKTVCGSLKCPPYKPDTDVPCVVCSK